MRGPVWAKATELTIPQKAAKKGVKPVTRSQMMIMSGITRIPFSLMSLGDSGQLIPGNPFHVIFSGFEMDHHADPEEMADRGDNRAGGDGEIGDIPETRP